MRQPTNSEKVKDAFAKTQREKERELASKNKMLTNKHKSFQRKHYIVIIKKHAL